MTGIDATTGQVIDDFAAVAQSIERLLVTPKGSIPLRRDYGTGLMELLDSPLTGLMRIRSEVADSILRHEPRFRCERVDVVDSPKAGHVTLAIHGVFAGQRRSLEVSL